MIAALYLDPPPFPKVKHKKLRQRVVGYLELLHRQITLQHLAWRVLFTTASGD